MKTTLLLLLITVGIVVRGDCADFEYIDLAIWRIQASQIKPGTSLNEVKKLLGISELAHRYAKASEGPILGLRCMEEFALDKNVSAIITWQEGSYKPILDITVRLRPSRIISNDQISPISPNQSLERTPLGRSVCMGLPCMVSLSSRR
jgi:hypothetical protein